MRENEMSEFVQVEARGRQTYVINISQIVMVGRTAGAWLIHLAGHKDPIELSSMEAEKLFDRLPGIDRGTAAQKARVDG